MPTYVAIYTYIYIYRHLCENVTNDYSNKTRKNHELQSHDTHKVKRDESFECISYKSGCSFVADKDFFGI